MAVGMRAYVGVTDFDWFAQLSNIPNIDEVNFWQPGGNTTFKAVNPGELFLFKLHSPRNFIVGGGIFAHASANMPVSLVWESFGEKNGARTFQEMRERVAKYRRVSPATHEDFRIGCILLEQPFFLPESKWVPVPTDWSPNIVQGKRYDLTTGLGATLWADLQEALRSTHTDLFPSDQKPELPAGSRYGSPVTVLPRLGQGSFRILVTDTYNRRCAITGEKTLPVLEAAHIKPYASGGTHEIRNGILFRSDIHTLFDRGYVTVTPDYKFEVSKRIKEEFENGRDYYALRDKEIRVPERLIERPSEDYLKWHNEVQFKG